MGNRTKPFPGASSGFVLASTLWVVAILLLVVAGFETYISGELKRSQELRDKVKSSVDILSTEQVLRYLLSTHRQTLAGLDLQTSDLDKLRNEDGLITLNPVGGELKFDGRVYQGIGKVLFSIQDESGLIPVSSTSTFAIVSYLQAAGASTTEISKYRDRLKDYWDVDNLRRLNGAEKALYLKESMPSPRNDYLRTHTEINNVLGWADFLQSVDDIDAPERVFSSSRDAKVNLNNMPLSLLGLFSEQPETVIQMRDQRSFRSTGEVKSQIPELNNWPEEGFRFAAGSRFRLEMWVEGSIQSEIIGLELSPFNLRGSLREHYRFSSLAPAQPRLASGADSKNVLQQFNAVSSR